MSTPINTLEPKTVWENFAKICAIPHPSKHEGKIIDYIKTVGENLGLNTVVDEAGNVIIKKPATPGCETKKTVVLQSHLDMVPQKNEGVDHDFEKDPIKPIIDGEWIRADKTTLGADNGIGVACMLSILQSDEIKHGPIEALFTIDEETGMGGAFALQPNVLEAEIMLNLDSEDEGELYIGCAGGIDANIKFHYLDAPMPENSVAYKVTLKGLKGGHSGLDINLGRGNSIKLLNRFLWLKSKNLGIKISHIDGGSLRNAIPREAYAHVVVDQADEQQFLETVKTYAETIKNELKNSEPDIIFNAEPTDLPFITVDARTQHNLLNALYACPNGVIRMSDSLEGVVETSTNLASIKMEPGVIDIQCLLRSSVDSAKNDLTNMMDSVFTLANADISFEGEYPGWNPNSNSGILMLMKEIYEKEYGKKPEVKVIHAGLECGIISGKYPNMEIVSFGPTIRHPHSPDEKVNIKTVGKFYDYLVKTLEAIPEK